MSTVAISAKDLAEAIVDVCSDFSNKDQCINELLLAEYSAKSIALYLDPALEIAISLKAGDPWNEASLSQDGHENVRVAHQPERKIS